MIVNIPHANGIVRQLMDSRYDFYLTGSRFFGGSNSKSDWDYFTQWSLGVESFLIDLGFQDVTCSEASYNDGTIFKLYACNDMHIQLVHDAEHKNKVQSYLTMHTSMRNVPKDARRHLWNMAFSIVNLHTFKEAVK